MNTPETMADELIKAYKEYLEEKGDISQ